MIRKIHRIVIGSSGTLQTASLSHVHAYWCDELYLRHPDFHYIICPDGKTVQMLGLELAAGGSEKHNAYSVNIAYIGGIDEGMCITDNRTPAQKTAILKLLRELREQFPEAEICGYRVFPATGKDTSPETGACCGKGHPGFDVKAAYRHV